MPVFNAAIDPQHRFVAPGRVAGLRRKKIPVVLVSSRPCHHVDTGSSPQYLAHAQWNGAAVEMWVGLSDEAPVAHATQVQMPLIRFHDAWHVVASARLDQQHADLWILGQSARDHRSRRAGSTDNEIVMRLQLMRKLPLIRTYALTEIRRRFRALLKIVMICLHRVYRKITGACRWCSFVPNDICCCYRMKLILPCGRSASLSRIALRSRIFSSLPKRASL